MKPSISQVLAAALLTTASVFTTGTASVAEDNFKRISTEKEFREIVVGKRLNLEENYVTAKANGRLTGKFGGETLKGAWAWRDGYFCRTLSTHSKNTDCQLWAVSGNKHKVTRERGKGKSFTYTVK